VRGRERSWLEIWSFLRHPLHEAIHSKILVMASSPWGLVPLLQGTVGSLTASGRVTRTFPPPEKVAGYGIKT